jgi:hypothetical protein
MDVDLLKQTISSNISGPVKVERKELDLSAVYYICCAAGTTPQHIAYIVLRQCQERIRFSYSNEDTKDKEERAGPATDPYRLALRQA